MRIAVLGGTGDFGLALARQLVAVGEDVVIGSRDAERAVAKGAEIGAAGAANEDAVRGADLVVLAVKSDAALPTAQYLAQAIGDTPVLSVASELRFTKHGVFPTDDARSIAERTQDLLDAPVTAGLHSLAAASLAARQGGRGRARLRRPRGGEGAGARAGREARLRPCARRRDRSRAHARSKG